MQDFCAVSVSESAHYGNSALLLMHRVHERGLDFFCLRKWPSWMRKWEVIMQKLTGRPYV